MMKLNLLLRLLAVFVLTLVPFQGRASLEGSQTFSVDGMLYQAGTTNPLLDASVSLRLRILNEAKDCVLYEETQTVNTSSSAGYFNINVGSAIGAGKRSSGDSGNSMKTVFQNLNVVSGKSASDGTTSCTSAASNAAMAQTVRFLQIRITPSSTGIAENLTPEMRIDAVPNAMVAESVQGVEAQQILQVNSGSGLTQTALQNLMANAAISQILAGTYAAPNAVNVTGTVAIANGGTGATTAAGARAGLGLGPLATMSPTGTASASTYLRGDGSWATPAGAGTVTNVTSSNSDIAVATGSSTPVLTLNAGTSANQILKLDGSGRLPAVDGSQLTNLIASQIPNIDASKITSGVIGTARLGSGTADNTTYLRGDGTWATVTSGGAGAPLSNGQVWIGNGSNVAAARGLQISDIQSTVGGLSFLNTTPSCSGDGKALLYNSVSDRMACADVVTSSAIVAGLAATTGIPKAPAAPALGQNMQSLRWNNGSSQWEWFTPGVAGSGLSSLNAQTGSSQTFGVPGTAGTAPGWSSASDVHTLNIPMASAAGVTAGLISKTEFDAFNAKLSSTGLTANSLLTTNASGAISYSNGSTGAILQGSPTGPAWSTATYPTSTTANQLLFSSAANTVGGLTTANNGVLVTNGSGVPSIGSTLPSAVQGNITSLGTVTSGTWQGTAVGAIYGGTGQTTYATGDILYSSASNTLAKLGIGSAGQVLTVAGGVPTWSAAPADSSKVAKAGDSMTGALSIALSSASTGVAVTQSGAGLAASFAGGNVMVGTQATRATASARGQLAATSTYTQTSAGAFTLDWNNGNIQEVANFLCNGTATITMTNMQDGGAYSLLISGTAAHSGVCNFAGTGLTFKTQGGATAPTASKDILITFARIGNTVVYTMIDNL